MNFLSRRLFYLVFCVFGISATPVSGADSIVINTPAISEGSVYNSSYFFGTISIKGEYTNDLDENNQVFYALDASGDNLPSWISATSTSRSTELTVGPPELDYHSRPSFYPDGSFISVGGKGDDIYFQRFSADGTELFPPMLIGENKGWQAKTAVMENGSFFVFWQSVDLPTCVYGSRAVIGSCEYGNEREIIGQQFDSLGSPEGSEFKLTSATSISETRFEMTQLNSGGFFLTWQSKEPNGYFLYSQFFDASGDPMENGNQIPLNSSPGLSEMNWSSTVLEDGGAVIVWQSPLSDGNRNVTAKLLDESGSDVVAAFRVNSMEISESVDTARPVVAPLSTGGFSVSWQNIVRHCLMERVTVDCTLKDNLTLLDEVDDSYGIFVREFDASGYPVDGNQEVRVNLYAGNDQKNPAIAPLAEGRYVVVWEGFGPDDTSDGIYGQKFQPGGAYFEEVFRINQSTEGKQTDPLVIGLNDPVESVYGSFLVTWKDMNETVKAFKMRRFDGPGSQAEIRLFSFIYPWGRHVTPASLPDGGFVVPFNGFKASRIELFPLYRSIYVEDLFPSANIDIQLRLVSSDGSETISPVRSYLYADPNEGEGYVTLYQTGYLDAGSMSISTDLPATGNFTALQLYQSTAPLENDACGPFGVWTAVGDNSPSKRSLDIMLNDATCYQFKWFVTNITGNQIELSNAGLSHSGIVKIDRSPPELSITDSISYDTITLQIETLFEATSITSSSYQVNSQNAVSFSGTTVELKLNDGANHIQLEFTDTLGHTVKKHLFPTIDLSIPEIHLTGIEEGSTYGDEVAVRYLFTQELTDLIIFVDDEPVTDVQIFVNGVLRNDLSGLESGTHSVVVQGKDALGNDVYLTYTLMDGELRLDVTQFAEGAHTLTFKAKDNGDNDIIKTVVFNIDYSVFAINLLSPQNRTYLTDSLTVQYHTSKTLQRVWYNLNGGPDQENLTLTGLPDGVYEITLHAQATDNSTASASTQFTIQQGIAELEVVSPQAGQIYGNQSIEIAFATNSDVTYSVGTLNGPIISGQTLTLADGEHTLLLTATHPVSGNQTVREISFSVDTVVPEVDITSPLPMLYAFTDIPVSYSTNKPLTNIQMFLDGSEISELTDLSTGLHEFQFIAEDASGKKVSRTVQFNVVHLDVVSPQPNENVISNVYPPVLPFVYDADGLFNNLTVGLDMEKPQLIVDPPGSTIPLQTYPGNHEVYLRGQYNEFSVSKRTEFAIGSKNAVVDAGAINYSYADCESEGVSCEVTVELMVKNTGNYAINEPISIHFFHVTESGNYQTQIRQIPSLNFADDETLTLDPFRATFGDTFLVMLDPYDEISGEKTEDNSSQVTFVPGIIADYSTELKESNVYFQNISVFDVMDIETVGPVNSIEVDVNGFRFVDNTKIDGFQILYDIGRLDMMNPCITIQAYDDVHRLLDSRRKCYQILNLNGAESVVFPWKDLESYLDAVVMSELDILELVQEQEKMFQKNLESSPAVIKEITNDKGIRYFLISYKPEPESLVKQLDLSVVPIVGEKFDNITTGSGGVTVTSVDLGNRSCTNASASQNDSIRSIKIKFDMDGYLDTREILSEAESDPQKTPHDWLSTQQALEDQYVFINDAADAFNLMPDQPWLTPLSQDSFFVHEDTELFELLSKSDGPFNHLIDVFFNQPGFFDLIAHVGFYGHISDPKVSADFDFTAKFKSNSCIISDLDGEINVATDSELNLSTTGDISVMTPDGGGVLGLLTTFKSSDDYAFNTDLMLDQFFKKHMPEYYLKDLQIPIPALFGYGYLNLYPHEVNVKSRFNSHTRFTQVNGDVKVKSHSRFDASADFHERLADGFFNTYSFLGLGGETRIHARLDIDALAKFDIIEAKPQSEFKYGDGYYNLHISTKTRKCFLIFCEPWDKESDKTEDQGSTGINYTDDDVNLAVENTEPISARDFIIDNYNLGALAVFYALQGEAELATSAASCGIAGRLIVDAPQMPLFSKNDQGVCEAVLPLEKRLETFTSPACSADSRVAYNPQNFFDYCQDHILRNDHSMNYIGNPKAWDVNDRDPDPEYQDLGINQKWTLPYIAATDLLMVPLGDNYLPYVKQVEYRTVNNCSLGMRIYKKNIGARNLRPLMHIHGGAWTFRGIAWETIVSHYTEMGYVVFAPFYRLLEDVDGPVECRNATGADMIQDITAALDWVKTNGYRFGADPAQKVTLSGRSAGGHLSGYLAMHRSADVEKALLLYPPTDFEFFIDNYGNAGTDGALFDSDIWTTGAGTIAHLVAQYDTSGDLMPLEEVDSSAPFVQANSFPKLLRNWSEAEDPPPVFLIHGNADTVVPVHMSTRLCEALTGLAENTLPTDSPLVTPCGSARGVTNMLHVVDGANHVLDLSLSHLETLGTYQDYNGVFEAHIALTNGFNWMRDN